MLVYLVLVWMFFLYIIHFHSHFICHLVVLELHIVFYLLLKFFVRNHTELEPLLGNQFIYFRLLFSFFFHFGFLIRFVRPPRYIRLHDTKKFIQFSFLLLFSLSLLSLDIFFCSKLYFNWGTIFKCATWVLSISKNQFQVRKASKAFKVQ